MPGAAYGDDDARDIPEKELYPAESAFAGPARVADQCDPAETVILHAPVDAVMTYTWDARRGRNLPLILLLVSGLYLFALPYVARWRRTPG